MAENTVTTKLPDDNINEYYRVTGFSDIVEELMDRRDNRYSINNIRAIPNYSIPESNRITGEGRMHIRGIDKIESYHKAKKKKKSKMARKSRQINHK